MTFRLLLFAYWRLFQYRLEIIMPQEKTITTAYSPSFQPIGSVSSLTNNLAQLAKKRLNGVLYFYWGHYDYHYEDIAPIFRKNADGKYIHLEKEDHIFRELLRRCPDDFSTCTTIFERLVKMQHYSLPTRLLDITSNPLVALYFACKKTEAENGKDEDGALIIY